MLLIFRIHLPHLIILVRKKNFGPDFAIWVLFIVKIFGESIVDFDKYE